jgi:hypothetical protein
MWTENEIRRAKRELKISEESYAHARTLHQATRAALEPYAELDKPYHLASALAQYARDDLARAAEREAEMKADVEERRAELKALAGRGCPQGRGQGGLVRPPPRAAVEKGPLRGGFFSCES